MISTKFAVPVLVLVCGALVPTVLHSYLGATRDDGHRTARVSPRLAGFVARPVERPAGWMTAAFDSSDWVRREYRGRGRELTLFAVRSYDAKRLYHHPELALLHGIDWPVTERAWLGPALDIPAWVLRKKGQPGLAVYALRQNGRAISDPYLFQLQEAPRLLFSPRSPMTLFLVHDPANQPGAPLEQAPAVQLLVEAVRSFELQTVPGLR